MGSFGSGAGGETEEAEQEKRHGSATQILGNQLVLCIGDCVEVELDAENSGIRFPLSIFFIFFSAWLNVHADSKLPSCISRSVE
jgi:hypothetical protein